MSELRNNAENQIAKELNDLKAKAALAIAKQIKAHHREVKRIEACINELDGVFDKLAGATDELEVRLLVPSNYIQIHQKLDEGNFAFDIRRG